MGGFHGWRKWVEKRETGVVFEYSFDEPAVESIVNAEEPRLRGERMAWAVVVDRMFDPGRRYPRHPFYEVWVRVRVGSLWYMHGVFGVMKGNGRRIPASEEGTDSIVRWLGKWTAGRTGKLIAKINNSVLWFPTNLGGFEGLNNMAWSHCI
ncbi:hypothetical protein K432DRAFT_198306 [Lepidopterella palustris CBS 459.81]|uniref:Uncharacterized protein n=1 Tax=Lepidopterella palustris CBS 459.81 TaxID=1314670 RepID=A0A8E2DZC1_9PEZI|nr:hypothetical protein K432DRAFT_198306 [Lepidopterella palustris CBS 459.81]